MALINYASREINCKIVYYGPGLSGKTTNLQYIYDKLSPDSRGKLVSLATEGDRTLFFDFLPVDLGKIRDFTTRFHLYTVPGQVYYNESRKLVLREVDGIVFVADSLEERLDADILSLQNLRANLMEQYKHIETTPLVIQYNKRDLQNILPIEKLEQELNYLGVPSFEAVAYKGIGVFQTLKCIGKMVVKSISGG